MITISNLSKFAKNEVVPDKAALTLGPAGDKAGADIRVLGNIPQRSFRS